MSNITLDPAILKALPRNCKVTCVSRHGKTNWAKGLRIDVELEGQRNAYFIKITEREDAIPMARGEFESQREMKNSVPENAAKALVWGPLDDNPSHAFYMCEFRDLYVPEDTQGNSVKPSPSEVASIMIGLHRASSPNGKFGFPVPTFKGYAPMNNEWCDKWEDWFARQFRMDIRFEQSLRGPDPEMDELLEEFVEKVIPRLLRPLQTNGRSIKPSLVHTDIWHGNIHRDRASQKPVIFDACCIYGHHEMELGMFREQYYGWSPEYMQEYLKGVQPSEPREDFDDRIALYAMRNYIVTAALWQHWIHLRGFVKTEMRRLLEKHPDGIGGFIETVEITPGADNVG